MLVLEIPKFFPIPRGINLENFGQILTMRRLRPYTWVFWYQNWSVGLFQYSSYFKIVIKYIIYVFYPIVTIPTHFSPALNRSEIEHQHLFDLGQSCFRMQVKLPSRQVFLKLHVEHSQSIQTKTKLRDMYWNESLSVEGTPF